MRVMNFGYRNTFQSIDKGTIEVFGPLGFAFNVQPVSHNLSRLQSGSVGNYATLFLLAVISFLAILLASILILSSYVLVNPLIAFFGYVIFCYTFKT